MMFEIVFFISSASLVSSSISGVSYLDPIDQTPLKPLPGEDPCNPLYWYPKNIPEYCYAKKPGQPKFPVPVPAQPSTTPVPIPPIAIPMPYSMPPLISFYPQPVLAFSRPVPQFIPPQFLPSLQMPYRVPLPPPMMPDIPYPPFQPSRQPAGLVPGIPGMISPDGGINILPFSDAYSDMLEKHKQKMLRKRLQKVLDDYEDYSLRRKHRKHRGERY